MRLLPSSEVTLRDPRSLSLSAEGLLYIADTGHHRIVAVDSAGRLIAETGGFGTAHGQFQWPRSVIANRGNAVWVLDYGNRRIEKFSRLLEYQGTLEITEGEGGIKHQPEAMAVSAQGDIFVYDRDAGQIIRFDPLFRQQAELGGGTGSQFITNLSAMEWVTGRGLFWWERGSVEMKRADGLLNPMPSLKINPTSATLIMASMDSCLYFGSDNRLWQSCSDHLRNEICYDSTKFAGLDNLLMSGLAASVNRDFYLLDGRTGTVYRRRSVQE